MFQIGDWRWLIAEALRQKIGFKSK